MRDIQAMMAKKMGGTHRERSTSPVVVNLRLNIGGNPH